MKYLVTYKYVPPFSNIFPLYAIPEDIPRNSTEVLIRSNNIPKIRAGAFAYLSECILLELTANMIFTLQPGAFVGLIKLRNLNLYHNKITGISSKVFRGLQSLHVLDLSDNLLMTLEANVFLEMPELRTLNLANNKIMDIIQSAFYGLSSLVKLNLDYNNIQEIKDGTFNYTRMLQDLSLIDSNLNFDKNTWTGLDRLLFFRINYCHWNKHSDFRRESGMEKMLKNNSFRQLGQVVLLHLDNYEITSLEINGFQGLAKLETFSLMCNKISSLKMGTFLHLSNLQSLRLIHNYLQYILKYMFQGPKCLSELKLSYNVISFIENSAFEHQGCLRELLLDNNNLTTITEFTFLGLKNLVYIWLQNNKIHTINPNSFLLMPCSFLLLELSNNRLASLKWNVFRDEYSCFHRNYWKTLKLNLDGNNMSCSSDTCWIEDGIKQGSIILSPTEEGSFASQQCRISCPTAGCQVSFQNFDHDSWAFSFH